MSDDAYYISPHETALAVVATAMKKARLRPTTLILNAVAGGVLFSTGGLLYTCCHASNPDLLERNPGLLNFLGASTFSIGLFYVVINGTDLFNSNILFFSVAVLRRAVSVYDVIISWAVSWIGNFAGTIFVVYVICFLSGVTRSDDFVKFTKQMVKQKDSSSFIQTFIKGVAGNFYVCLAIYLQLMSKPLHVKFIMMTLPIFTFVAAGFTHVVADMFLLMVGMFNGADLSVGRFIWKHMIAATLGNIVGGGTFALVIPFYLHLVVVESDRARLSLPNFEARDEQPEINMDSRVVRIPTEQAEEVEEEAEENEFSSEEKKSPDQISSDSSLEAQKAVPPVEYRPSLRTPRLTRTHSNLRRVSTNRSYASVRSLKSLPHRTPLGVFPVKGMATPRKMDTYTSMEGTGTTTGFLSRTFSHRDSQISSHNSIKPINHSELPIIQRSMSTRSNNTAYTGNASTDDNSILESKMGTKLERALTRITSRVSREKKRNSELPITTQKPFTPSTASLTPSFFSADGRSSVSLQGPGPSYVSTMRNNEAPSVDTNNLDSFAPIGEGNEAAKKGTAATVTRVNNSPSSQSIYEEPGSQAVSDLRRPSNIYTSTAVGQKNTDDSVGNRNRGIVNSLSIDNDHLGNDDPKNI